MPRIFDNIEQSLLPALRDTLKNRDSHLFQKSVSMANRSEGKVQIIGDSPG